jgi:hypothetical protein
LAMRFRRLPVSTGRRMLRTIERTGFTEPPFVTIVSIVAFVGRGLLAQSFVPPGDEPSPSINDPLDYRLEFTMEIHDEDLPPNMTMEPRVPQATLGSPIIGKPNNLDEAIANVRKNLPNAPTAT